MTTNFLFRALPGQSLGRAEDLLKRVAELGAELIVDGQVEDFNAYRASLWEDSSGPAVLMPISGPPGWHYHSRVLERYGVDCRLYP